MSNRRIICSAENVIDYFNGNFNIPCDGAESDIEGFEDDDSDVDEPISVAGEIILPRYPDKGSENENSDSGEEERERGRPVHFMFEDHKWSDQKCF